MLGLKFIAVVLLIGAVSPTQATSVSSGGNLLGGLVGKVLGAVDGLVNAIAGCKGDKNGIVGVLKALLGHVIKLDIPKTVDALAKLICQLGLTLQQLLDILVPGLGTAVYKIIGGLAQFVFCGLGSPGLTGQMFGEQKNADICSSGFFPKGGLDGKCDAAAVKKIIGQGCNEGKKIWGKKKSGLNLEGLLKVVLELVEDVLGIGNKCKDSEYSIGLDDLLEVLTKLGIFVGGCNEHYNIVDGVVSFLEELLDSLFGSILDFDGGSIKSQTKKCAGGSGLEKMSSCFNK